MLCSLRDVLIIKDVACFGLGLLKAYWSITHNSGISKEKSNLDLNRGSVLYLENTQKGRFAQEKNICLVLTLPLTSSQGCRQDS